MEVASEMTEYKHESSMEITDNTRSVVGCCLGMIYESMYDEPRRNQMLEEIDKFCKWVKQERTNFSWLFENHLTQ